MKNIKRDYFQLAACLAGVFFGTQIEGGVASGGVDPPPESNRPKPEDVSQSDDKEEALNLRDGNPGIRMNFRNAPLDAVLNYLSEAAGFIIDQRADVKGRVTVWSDQPLSSDEAVEVLNAALS
jgi:hypothetical protein